VIKFNSIFRPRRIGQAATVAAVLGLVIPLAFAVPTTKPTPKPSVTPAQVVAAKKVATSTIGEAHDDGISWPDWFLKQFGKMRRPHGMTPEMFRAFIKACVDAKVSPQRVMQTIGNAKASAGVHAQDGAVVEVGYRYIYCAAVDLRSRDLTRLQIKTLLNSLADQGYVGWWRREGSFANNQHFHIIYVGHRMKLPLRLQFKDAIHDKTGLVGHRRETFFVLNNVQKHKLRVKYFRYNPVNN
jgi:hypothetical protein